MAIPVHHLSIYPVPQIECEESKKKLQTMEDDTPHLLMFSCSLRDPSRLSPLLQHISTLFPPHTRVDLCFFVWLPPSDNSSSLRFGYFGGLFELIPTRMVFLSMT